MSTLLQVDDWGRDTTFVRVGSFAAGLRWRVSLGGAEHVPQRTGALIVTNARRFALTPLLVAWAVGDATGRPVRFVGRHDIAPFGDLSRRLGGLLAHPDEVRSALRHREIVVVGTDAVTQLRRAGEVPIPFVAAAVDAGAQILPAATVTTPFGRHARIEMAAPVRPTNDRRGPLREVETAEHVRRRLQHLLDAMGGDSVLDLIGEL
jgi:hypothetical protein